MACDSLEEEPLCSATSLPELRLHVQDPDGREVMAPIRRERPYRVGQTAQLANGPWSLCQGH